MAWSMLLLACKSPKYSQDQLKYDLHIIELNIAEIQPQRRVNMAPQIAVRIALLVYLQLYI